MQKLEKLQVRELLQSSIEYRNLQVQLVNCIAKLNAVANNVGKGRGDLNSKILFGAISTLCRIPPSATGPDLKDPSKAQAEETEKNCSSQLRAHRALQVMARDIVGSFEDFRSYLRKVSQCLQCVDPHLCNNTGLVARLVDWEETWEYGARFMREPRVLEALSQILTNIFSIQSVVPSLSAMFEEYDAELFMVLPRLVLLTWLADAISLRGDQQELLKFLLPHRLLTKESKSKALEKVEVEDSKKLYIHPELQALVVRYRRTVTVLTLCLDPDTPLLDGKDTLRKQPDVVAREAIAWNVLAQRVVLGDLSTQKGSEEAIFSCVDPSLLTTAKAAANDFSLVLERWSLELQRHRAEYWNHTVQVLVRCLTSTSRRQKLASSTSSFQV